jgi:rubrerythrin
MFTNPFVGQLPTRKLSKDELVRALRLDLAAEEEAIHLYTAHADNTEDETVRKVLLDIADEERIHSGEILSLIELLTCNEDEKLAEGSREVERLAGRKVMEYCQL